METNSIGSDGTDELLTSLDPLLDQSNQLVLESSRDDKSFASTFRSSSCQGTVRTNDSKSSDGRLSKQRESESPRFDPRHATVAEILERTDRQLKALSASRKSNFQSPPPTKPQGLQSRDQKPKALTNADTTAALWRTSAPTVPRLSENRSQSQQEIVISRPVLTRSNGLKEIMDWSKAREENLPPSHLPPHHPSSFQLHREQGHFSSLEHQHPSLHSHIFSEASTPASASATAAVAGAAFSKKSFSSEEPQLRQRLFDAEHKASEMEREIGALREKCARKDSLLLQLDKNFSDVVLKGKGRENEKEEIIVELRGQLRASQEQAASAQRDLARLQALLSEAEHRLQQKDDATAALMTEAQEARRKGTEEVNRLRDELEVESSRKSDLLRRNQAASEENMKLAKSLAAMEKAVEQQRVEFSFAEKEHQSKGEKLSGEVSHLNDVIRKQDAVIGDLQRALRMAQSELERWKAREGEWAEERKTLWAQGEAKRSEWEIATKRWEAEQRAKHEKELSEERASHEVARSQAEQRLREAHRDEIHALGARHQKELAQLRERADAEIERRAAAQEEAANDLRGELTAARERAEYYRLKSCESEAQRLRTLSQMQALMQASCSQALSVLNKPSAFEAPPPPVRTVLEAVQEVPALEPGDGLDIIDSLVPNGAVGSRPASARDLINLGSEKAVSPAPL